MISEPTVLILGAGASNPYGFPTGTELRERLVKTLSDRATSEWSLLRSCNYKDDEIEKLLQAVTYGDRPTIDELLGFRNDLVGIGKAAIAMLIGRCENPAHLRGDWYQVLVENILDTDKRQINTKLLAVITYNYDRSLEFYLQRISMGLMGLGPDEANDAVSKLNIVHLHGMLGHSDKKQKNYRDYNYSMNELTIQAAAKDILVIHESSAVTNEYQRAHNYLHAASKIIFLGFGFDRRNMTRLVSEGKVDLSNKKIYGTAVGVDGELIYRFFRENGYRNPSFPLLPLTCLNYLKGNAIL